MHFTTILKNGKNSGRELWKSTQAPCGQFIPKSKGGRVWAPNAQLLRPPTDQRHLSAASRQREAGIEKLVNE